MVTTNVLLWSFDIDILFAIEGILQTRFGNQGLRPCEKFVILATVNADFSISVTHTRIAVRQPRYLADDLGVSS